MHRKNQENIWLLMEHDTFLDWETGTINHGELAYMTKIKFYENAEDELLQFAVIISKSQNKYIFC